MQACSLANRTRLLLGRFPSRLVRRASVQQAPVNL